MNFPLRFLSGIPLIIMSGALLLLAVQDRFKPGPPGPSYLQMMVDDGRLGEAEAWAKVLAGTGTASSLRDLAAVSDLAGDPGGRATALQSLVRQGKANFVEHIEAARALAAAGAFQDALTVLYNAVKRFPDRIDERFLAFFAAVARDAGRPDVALPLAQRMWKKTGSDDVLKVMVGLGAG